MDVEAENQANSQFSRSCSGVSPLLFCRIKPATTLRIKNLTNRIYPWFLCFLSFVVQFLVLGFFKGFGSVYIALQAEFNDSDALTAWVGSISFALTYMLTPLTFKICNRYGFRIPMFVGGILYGLGLLTSSFVPNIPTLYVTLGVLFAMGESLCFSASLLILPLYFTKNWSLAHGIALSGNSTGALAISPALEYLLTTYGFKRGFQIMSVGSVVLIIISVFYKRPESKEKEEGTKSKEASVDGEQDNEEEAGRDAEKEDINDIEGPIIPLRRNKAFITFITGTTLMHFGYYIPFVHLVRMAMDLNISRTKAVLLPGYMSVAQSFGKLILGKVATMPRADKIVMYQFALIANCLATTLCPIITTYTGLIIYAVVFGLADGCTSANNMLVVGDLVSRKQLSSGYSVFLVTSAASFLIGPPVAGLLYDLTGAYDLAFFFSGGTAALAACVMFLVPILRIKQGIKNQTKLITAEDNKDNLSREDETKKLDLPKVDIYSKSDSGISMIITDNSPQSSNSHSDVSLNIKEGTQELLPKFAQTHTVWNDGLHVEVIPSTLHKRQLNEAKDDKMQFCSGFFPLVLDEKELDELLNKESNV